MKSPSITTRILIAALLPAVLVTLLLSTYLIVARVNEIGDVEIEQATALLEGLAKAGEFGVATANGALLESIGRSALGSVAVREIRFSGANGELLARVVRDPPAVAGSNERPMRWWWHDAESRRRLVRAVTLTDLSEFDDPLLHANKSSDGGRLIGSVSLELDLSAAFAQQTLAVRRGVMFALLVLLFALPAAWRLARSVSEPVHRLLDAVGELAQRRYVDRLPVSTGGELGDLSRAVLHLSNESRAFHGGLEAATLVATQELRDALETLEARNQELSEARALAERANLAKSQFLASISHEIRTPMHAIVGTLSTLRHSSLDADQQSQLGLVERSSSTLLAMLDDVLDLSRIEAGHLQLDSVPFNLGELLQEVEWTHAGSAKERGLLLSVAPLPGKGPINVIGDPLRLKQVLFNLFANAIKFTAKGSVRLDIGRRATGSSDGGAPWWRFSVIDTGMGIPADRLSSMFEPFEQADMSTTRRFGGAGLGLHICREIVGRMGGTIDLRSTEGEGTRVDVLLPLPATAATSEATTVATDASKPTAWRQAPASDDPADGCIESLKVLAVDDKAINLGLLGRYFDYLGVKGTLAQSAEEAFEALQRERFDLLLLDLHMPDSDGFEIAAAVRDGESPSVSVPILALTADAFRSTRERALASGFDDVLVKPVTIERIGKALEQWIDYDAVRSDGGLEPGSARSDDLLARDAVQPDEGISLERTASAAAGDIDWARTALDAFENEVPEHIAALEAALCDEDRDALFRTAHAIKGVSAVLGIDRTCKAADRLSHSARSGVWQAIRIDTDCLLAAMAEARVACREALVIA